MCSSCSEVTPAIVPALASLLHSTTFYLQSADWNVSFVPWSPGLNWKSDLESISQKTSQSWLMCSTLMDMCRGIAWCGQPLQEAFVPKAFVVTSRTSEHWNCPEETCYWWWLWYPRQQTFWTPSVSSARVACVGLEREREKGLHHSLAELRLRMRASTLYPKLIFPESCMLKKLNSNPIV